MLRDFELRDLDYFLSFFENADASQHVGGPSGTEDTWRRMLAGAGLWQLTGIGMWAVAERNGGPAIGHVGFFDFLRGSEPSIAGEAEMGWILAPSAHGKGYAREACEGILNWFDAQFGKRAIWALISPGNDPSMKLASKLGFIRQPDGTYREKPQTIWLRPA
ncbi:GNAT family N-acetyltransferase [Sphingomonas sp. SM33]|uniref:GNAT family N-acetyltransferase n=1 Tax=Sphingomonas telluris TaxID=2907998 RepID=A0ABS9VKX0_9SPHN|nr:GNAT family N-acetyltransferase [Sphingomonas telluris]